MVVSLQVKRGNASDPFALRSTKMLSLQFLIIKSKLFFLLLHEDVPLFFQGETVDAVRLEQNESAVRFVLISCPCVFASFEGGTRWC